jgi:hypothetical protein
MLLAAFRFSAFLKELCRDFCLRCCTLCLKLGFPALLVALTLDEIILLSVSNGDEMSPVVCTVVLSRRLKIEGGEEDNQREYAIARLPEERPSVVTREDRDCRARGGRGWGGCACRRRACSGRCTGAC